MRTGIFLAVAAALVVIAYLALEAMCRADILGGGVCLHMGMLFGGFLGSIF